MSENSYRDERNLTEKIFLIYWRTIWLFLSLMFPLRLGYLVRRYLLISHGGKVGCKVRIYPGVKVYDPRNIVIGANSTIGRKVNLYSVGQITIGSGTVVSQDCQLLTASHNFRNDDFNLVVNQITIGDDVWLSQGVMVGPGVKISSDIIIGMGGIVPKSLSSPGVYVSKGVVYFKPI